MADRRTSDRRRARNTQLLEAAADHNDPLSAYPPALRELFKNGEKPQMVLVRDPHEGMRAIVDPWLEYESGLIPDTEPWRKKQGRIDK